MEDISVEIRPVSPNDVTRSCEIEISSYPADEAASLEKLKKRQQHEPNLFLGRYHNGELIGYIAGSRYNGDVYTMESLDVFVDGGRSACIHTVCIEETHRRKGYALDLLKTYLQHVENTLDDIDRVMLMCKEDLISFYVKAGFQLKGPTAFSYGKDPWFECFYETKRNPPKEDS